MRVIGCLLGIHRKKWVGVFNYGIPSDDKKCPHGHWCPRIYCHICRKTVQIARWACEICIKMGERSIMNGHGLYKIEYGCLVPDEKRWGDPTDQKNRGERERQIPFDEVTRDGWTFVGRTQLGRSIMKKYFPEEKVWIFSVCHHGSESISVVPAEFLERSEGVEKYK